MVRMESLMRAIMNFYKYQSSENPIIIERVKEHDSEEMVMDRLERAIFDSCDENCKATPSRYAIWGEDIRGLSFSAKEAMKNGNFEQAEKLMNQVINSMGAFIDAQLILSDLPGRFSFVKSENIIESYITNLQKCNGAANSEKDEIIERMKEILDSFK